MMILRLVKVILQTNTRRRNANSIPQEMPGAQEHHPAQKRKRAGQTTRPFPVK
jgi:hypothetical protein